jgi:hypothetical protein
MLPLITEGSDYDIVDPMVVEEVVAPGGTTDLRMVDVDNLYLVAVRELYMDEKVIQIEGSIPLFGLDSNEFVEVSLWRLPSKRIVLLDIVDRKGEVKVVKLDE